MLRKFLLMGGISAFLFFANISAQDSSKITRFYSEFKSNAETDLSVAGDESSKNVLRLNDAVTIGLRNNPKLKARNLEISALRAAARQAGLYPNPSVGFDLENILGSGIYGGLGAGENTFFINQNFVLGGRLGKAEEIETLNSNLARWKFENERLALISEIRKKFVVISSLEHQNGLNGKLLKISNDFIADLERRIKAGKVSPAEASRAALISASLEIKIQNTKMRLASEIANLKLLLGENELEFSTVENICGLRYDIPQFKILKNLILESPYLARFKTEFKKVKSAVELEKSKAIPDLSFSVGYRRINETKDNAVVLGATIPLPVFNDNGGNIERAKIKENQTKYLFADARRKAEAKLQILYNNIIALESMIDKLENQSLPKADEALKIIGRGNLVGRFTVLDVLDAQRNLFELEAQFVNAVAEYNKSVIELEELTLSKFNYKHKARINDEHK